MPQFNYLNLDLRIEPWKQAYRARLSETGLGGEARQHFSFQKLSFSDQSQLDYPALQKQGTVLFNTIFRDETLGYLRRAQSLTQQSNTRFRLRLVLTDTPELAHLPWELLYDSAFDHFFSLSTVSPLVRFLDLPLGTAPLIIERPLRILLIISAPNDFPPLDSAAEKERIMLRLGELTEQGSISMDVLEAATLPALQKQLRLQDYHIIHFVGHGNFDPENQDGLLYFENDDKSGRAVSGQSLGNLLSDHRSIRLVFLNSCEGAGAADKDPFGGAAQNLVQRGLPAVIAMRTSISDEAAAAFAPEFFNALADGYPVDAALVEGRKAVYSVGSSDWHIPVLFLRAPDGMLFNIKISQGKSTQTPIITKASTTSGDFKPAEQESKSTLISEEIISDLCQHMERQRLALFIGADLPSRTTGIPSRRELAEGLARQENLPLEGNLATIAQQVMSHGNRWAFTEFLQSALDTVGKIPAELHHLLVNLVKRYDIENIIATSLDELLELAFQSAGISINRIVNDDDLKFIRPDRPTLIKLHGDLRQPNSLVVTEQDLNALIRGRIKPDLVDEIRRVFRRNCVLFIGYDLTEPDVNAWFDEISGNRFQIPSYAIWSGLTNRQAEAFDSNRGLKIIDQDPIIILNTLFEKSSGG